MSGTPAEGVQTQPRDQDPGNVSDDEGDGETAKDEDKKTKVLKKKKDSKVKFSALKTGGEGTRGHV